MFKERSPSQVTLKEGIEKFLTAEVPEISAVEAV
ncbi:MAG: NifU family protein [Deltaproteobacteria bacterium]|nr:NifU family protein [Deltaproteobacteria bacterium]